MRSAFYTKNVSHVVEAREYRLSIFIHVSLPKGFLSPDCIRRNKIEVYLLFSVRVEVCGKMFK